MRFISLSARLVLAAAALNALAACADATGPSDTPESLVLPAVALAAAPFPPELLIAVADADTRMLPALDADTRAPMHAALRPVIEKLLDEGYYNVVFQAAEKQNIVSQKMGRVAPRTEFDSYYPTFELKTVYGRHTMEINLFFNKLRLAFIKLVRHCERICKH